MFTVYRTLSARYLRRHWVRAVLIVASIALGVATLVATRALNETMNKAGLASVNPMPGVADLVVSNGDLTVSGALAHTLAQIPGVQEAWPRIFQNVRLPDLDNRSVLVLGIEPGEEQKGSGLDIRITKDPELLRLAAAMPKSVTDLAEHYSPAPAIVGRELELAIQEKYRKDGIASLPSLLSRVLGVSNQAKAWMDRLLFVQKDLQGPKTMLLRAGTVEATGVAASLSGNVLIMELADAAKTLGMKAGQVNRIDIVLKRGVNKSKLREEIENAIRGHGVVRTPEEQNQAIGSVMSGMQTGFSLCGLAALVVGLFLVYNALAVCVAERRHEIGVLLSLGAMRAQVLILFGGEALVLGLAGSLLGIPLGIGLAYLGLQPMQEVLRDIFFNIEADQVDISPGLILVAMGAGIVTAVAAALVPAVTASREVPAEAVRRIPKPPSRRHLAWQVAASLFMMLAGTACILLRMALPTRLGTYGGMILVLLGALVAAPLITAVVARMLQPWAQRFWPIHWRLAADNLVRAPGRTGLVIAALAAGIALVTQTYGTIISNRTSLRDWVQDAIAADLIVTSGSPIGAGGGQTQAMSEGLAKELSAIPGVEIALPSRFRKVPYQETQVLLFAIDAGGAYQHEKDRATAAANVQSYKILAESKRTCVISDNFAALHGVAKGDVLVLNSNHGEVRFLVVGQMKDYSWNHGTIFINRADYKQMWNDNEVDVFDVYVQPGHDVARVQESLLKKLGAEHGLVCETRHRVQERIEDMIEKLYGIALSQQFVVMFVAALGVVMALLISVLQRRREMGLLRAIGASSRQVVFSVLAEAFLMGVIGTVIGFLVGVPLEWYVLKVLILEESGYLFPVHVPWQEALIIVSAGLLTPILAGIGPALVSVRQRIPEAIAYE
jgi:putative ABC transport system permease protein